MTQAWIFANPVAFAACVSALAVLLSAAIAGGIAWVGHKTAQQNAKLAARTQAINTRVQMRQAWINSLRDSMARFQSYASTPDLKHRNERELYEFGTRIELFMNPNDELYEKLVDCLYMYLSADDLSEKWSPNSEYVDLCQKILRREWIVLKGELATLEH